MSPFTQINYAEIVKIVVISIVSTILFDLPMQEISKIVATYTENDTEIKSSEEVCPQEDSVDVVDTNEENVVDDEINEIWNNDSRTKVSFADNDTAEDDIYSKRSFTPVWKKSDDEKPVWGDDDEECEEDTE